MINKVITSHSLDELISVLDVQVYDDKYSRWVKNGEVRVCDIWDVIDDTLMMTVIDHRSDGDDIQQSITGILHHIGAVANVDAEDFQQAHEWITKFNEISNDVVIVGFGESWDDADSVALLALTGDQWRKILQIRELAELFYVI